MTVLKRVNESETVHSLLSNYSSTKWEKGRGRLFEGRVLIQGFKVF